MNRAVKFHCNDRPLAPSHEKEMKQEISKETMAWKSQNYCLIPRSATSSANSPQWVQTGWNWSIQFKNNLFSIISKGSDGAGEQMSERCKQKSRGRSEWSSTVQFDVKVFQPIMLSVSNFEGNDRANRKKIEDSEKQPREIQIPYETRLSCLQRATLLGERWYRCTYIWCFHSTWHTKAIFFISNAPPVWIAVLHSHACRQI